MESLPVKSFISVSIATVEHGYGKQAYPKITLTAKLSFIPLILKLHFKPIGYNKLLW